MPSIKQFQARIDSANRLLAKELPPSHRLRIAKLKLLDQIGITLRQKFPELDVEDPAEGGKVGIPRLTTSRRRNLGHNLDRHGRIG
jgi:hypothetical protein